MMNFCDEKPVRPQWAAIDGKLNEKPKQSGRKASVGRAPSSRSKKRLPWRICRMSDSGEIRLTSTDSNRVPATVQRPAAWYPFSRSQASG